MKLSEDFVIQEIGDDIVLVPVGEAAKNFHGIARLNHTAGVIVKQLKTDTTPERIAESLSHKYNGTREEFLDGITKTLNELRKCGAIIE